MKKFIAVLLSLSVAPLFLTTPVAALQAGDVVVSVRPSEQDFDIEPGQSYNGVVKVTNNGRLGFNFEVSASPFRVTNDNYDPDFTTIDSSTRLHNWVKFPEGTKFHIESGESFEVPFTIDVPEDIPGGGQYAAIMIRTTDSVDEGATIKVVTQVASLIYGHVIGGEERKEGALVEHSLPTTLFDKPLELTAKVDNTGNVDFKMRQMMTILNFFNGQEVITPDSLGENGEPIAAQQLTVLPGTSRTSTLTWEEAPKLGLFRVRQKITFLDEEFETEEVVFICPTWLPIGIIVFFTMGTFWLIVRGRQRKQRRPQVF